MRQITNNQTKLGFQPKEWEYHKTRIDTSKITGIKVTVYDNSPDIKPVYEDGRYKAKVQIWSGDRSHADTSSYEITNKLGQFKTFKNNLYKQDKYRDWYVKTVREVQTDIEIMGADLKLNLAACLGMRQNNADGQRGYAHVPEWAFALYHDGNKPLGKLYCGEHSFVCEFSAEDVYEVNGTRAYPYDLVFEQD